MFREAKGIISKDIVVDKFINLEAVECLEKTRNFCVGVYSQPPEYYYLISPDSSSLKDPYCNFANELAGIERRNVFSIIRAAFILLSNPITPDKIRASVINPACGCARSAVDKVQKYNETFLIEIQQGIILYLIAIHSHPRLTDLTNQDYQTLAQCHEGLGDILMGCGFFASAKKQFAISLHLLKKIEADDLKLTEKYSLAEYNIYKEKNGTFTAFLRYAFFGYDGVTEENSASKENSYQPM